MINTNKHVKINQSKNTLFDDSNWSYLGQIFFCTVLTHSPDKDSADTDSADKTTKFPIFQFYGTLNWTFRHTWPSTLISKDRSSGTVPAVRSKVDDSWEFTNDRPLWPAWSSACIPLDCLLSLGSSALTHRSSTLAQKIVCFRPDRLLSSFPGSSSLTTRDRPLSTKL